MGLCAQWLYPVYQQIKSTIMSGSYIQVDETTKRRSSTLIRETESVRKVICGSRANPAETWFLIGIPRERQAASKNSFLLILKAPSNVMVIPPTIVLPACGPKKANH